MKLKKDNHIKLSDLPKDIQQQMRATPYEIENSQRTHKQSYVIVKRTLVIDGEIYQAEMQLGNCDIRQSPDHSYDDIINYWQDEETGREVEPRVYTRDKASDIYNTIDLDECYVHITRIEQQGAGL